MNDQETILDTIKYVAVRAPHTMKARYYATIIDDLRKGEAVVIEGDNGLTVGIVESLPFERKMYDGEEADRIRPLVRRADEDDIKNLELGRKEAALAIEVAKEESDRLGLGMRFLDGAYDLEGKNLTLYFTSDARVDFRELLPILRERLECAKLTLLSVAPRDKAQMIGGIGICGLPLCCTRFLRRFEGISISRAKNQGLSLNTAKISGQCGKLMCCLLFEDQLYTDARKEFPGVGSVHRFEGKEWRVDSYNVISRNVKVTSKEESRVISLEELLYLTGKGPKPVERKPKERPMDLLSDPASPISLNEEKAPRNERSTRKEGKPGQEGRKPRPEKPQGQHEQQAQGNAPQGQKGQGNGRKRHRHRHHGHGGQNGGGNGPKEGR